MTNATTINDTVGTEALLMNAPGDAIDDTASQGGSPTGLSGVTVTAAGADSLLQGNLDIYHFGSGSYAGSGASGDYVPGGTTFTAIGNDTLSDTSGNTYFYGNGGQDNITLGAGGNTVVFGMYSINGDGSQTSGALLQLITEGTEASAPGFWGNGSNFPGGGTPDGGGGFSTTSDSITTITGWTLGSDTLQFNVLAWAATDAQLVDGVTLAQIPANAVSEGFSQYLGTPGITLGPAGPPGSPAHVYLVLDAIQIYANASDLAAGIEAGGIGNFLLGATPTIPVDILVAYSTGADINIADVHIHGTNANTASDTITASDMVQLVGLTSLANLGTNSLISFVHNSAV